MSATQSIGSTTPLEKLIVEEYMFFNKDGEYSYNTFYTWILGLENIANSLLNRITNETENGKKGNVTAEKYKDLLEVFKVNIGDLKKISEKAKNLKEYCPNVEFQERDSIKIDFIKNIVEKVENVILPQVDTQYKALRDLQIK